jgi:hypothetical protein
MPRKGELSVIRSTVVATATVAGRCMTVWASRYHGEAATERASSSAARRRRPKERALTRSPSRLRMAGSTMRAAAAATSATIMPPTPIE